MSSASSALIQPLPNNGVYVIFILSGNQIMPLYDACIDANIRIIHTRHEGAAVYMAEAYAQLSGKLGVALVTAGPGLLNAVSALYSAARSETPILLISGDAGLGMDGRGGFQELDQCAVTAPITKHSARPLNAVHACGHRTREYERFQRWQHKLYEIQRSQQAKLVNFTR